MRSGRADVELRALLADVTQVLDAAQVHQVLRACQAELHHRDQAHAAGQWLSAFGQQAQRFVERLGSGVFELLGNHAFLAADMSFQSFSGVSGISRCFTPNGDRASTTEFTTAGDAPIVPASPTPFTPKGFTGVGVTVWPLSIHGIMCARGMV